MQSRQSAPEVLDGLIETLAAIEHQRWSRWQQYMHSKGVRNDDGSMVIPADLVRRWEQQIASPYAELSETEKESDREQVMEYLSVIKKAFAATDKAR